MVKGENQISHAVIAAPTTHHAKQISKHKTEKEMEQGWRLQISENACSLCTRFWASTAAEDRRNGGKEEREAEREGGKEGRKEGGREQGKAQVTHLEKKVKITGEEKRIL